MTRLATPRKSRARSQLRIDSILTAARTLLAEEGVSSLSIYSVAEHFISGGILGENVINVMTLNAALDRLWWGGLQAQ